MKEAATGKRLEYLDSLRGVAALMVCFGHFINWRYGHLLQVKMATFFLNPNDAVSFFFVLSGMVLSLPYLQYEKKMDIGKFYVARVFRIFPAFLVTLVLLELLYIIKGDWTWYEVFIQNRSDFWKEALLILGVNKLYLPGWTLTIELCISFFMPFLIIVAKWNRQLLPWALLASLISAKVTGQFFFHFILGIMIAAHFETIKAATFRQHFMYRHKVAVAFLAMICFSLRHIFLCFSIEGTPLMNIGFYTLSGIAAFVFIILLVQSRSAQRFFEHPVMVFYGKISYSIYLTHFLFICLVWWHWDTHILPVFPNTETALIITALLYFAVTTASATLLHYFVELPFIKWGKNVAGRMKGTLSI